MSWEGLLLELDGLDVGQLRDRVLDLPELAGFEAEMAALDTTGMATGAIRRALAADPAPAPWEVGEGLAEQLLGRHLDAVWPWNVRRDRRTPRASLPGADLVGFATADDGNAILLFGEVKTSGEAASPPGVMNGRDGMVSQLVRLATDQRLQMELVMWLRPRCRGEHREAFEQAARRYFRPTSGPAFLLAGCLMRATPVNEADLRGPGRRLARTIAPPGVARLFAWYVPKAASDWSDLLQDEVRGG